MRNTRILIIALGILLPYLARIPGVLIHGPGWFTSYLGDSLWAPLFFGAFNAIAWGAILGASFTYRHARSVWCPALFGFSFLTLAHACLNLAASSTAAIALVFIPIYSLPFTFAGWLAGFWYDRKIAR